MSNSHLSVFEMEVAAAAYIVIDNLIRKKRRQRQRRWWCTQLYANRIDYGADHLLNDLKFQTVSGLYKNFTRMSPVDFEYLINLIGPKIMRKDTYWRKAIPVQQRLAVTIRFLATGDSFTSLQYLFKISKQAISEIVPEVCEALINGLKENIQIPTTPEKWLQVEKVFREIWNFPHCLGAIDGKHVILQAPFNTGSDFFNYKSTFSIVLFALVDGQYNFLYADAGGQGRISDGGIFKNCSLYGKLQKNELNFPPPEPLANRHKEVPYFFIGDEAFALSDTLLKPFSGMYPKGSPQRIFNYRLSRARRIVENVFGIISSVFRVLRKPILLQPEKAELVVMAIVHLHNFLRKSSNSLPLYTPHGTFHKENEKGSEEIYKNMDNEPMSSLIPIRNIPRRAPSSAQDIRHELSDFFQNEGQVPWQDQYA